MPVLLAVAQARAQGDTVCVGSTSVWAVEESPGVSYYWELYNDVEGIDLVQIPGNCPATEAYFLNGINYGSSVEVMCLAEGTYFIKATAVNSCPTNNLKVGKIVVTTCEAYAEFLEPPGICEGETAVMTVQINGGTAPWDITFTDGTTVWTIEGITESPYSFPLVPTPPSAGVYNYWITSVTDAIGVVNDTPGNPVSLVIHAKPVTSPITRY